MIDAHPTPCPPGDACPDARRYGGVHLTSAQVCLLRALSHDPSRTYADVGAALGWTAPEVGSVATCLRQRGLLHTSGRHAQHPLTRAGRAFLAKETP